ncbi:MAG: MFS transporter, partial [Phycicoccus sp.]|nr:MFS transporter [Phycicoccus sp.]
LVLASWGLGSLVGGLGYGALNRSISTFWLLLALGLVTIPMAFAATVTALAAVAFVAGLLCAPTITASIDQATRIVPPGARGEAMGWHGSFMTAGAALGAPLAGVAIDSGGPAAGFLAVALLGMAIAVVGASGAAVRRRRRRAAAEVRATLGA